MRIVLSLPSVFLINDTVKFILALNSNLSNSTKKINKRPNSDISSSIEYISDNWAGNALGKLYDYKRYF